MSGPLSGASTGGTQFGFLAAYQAGVPWDMIKPFVRSGAKYQADVNANRYIRSVSKRLPLEARHRFNMVIWELNKADVPRPDIALAVEEAVEELNRMGRGPVDPT